MSHKVFFSFSLGLSQTILAPAGTLKAIKRHVSEVEEVLSIKRTQHGDGPPRWDMWDADFRAGFPDVDDKTLCETVQAHNDWVRRLYDDVAEWANCPVEGGDEITPEAAADFWPGLQIIAIRPDRWTEEYHRNRMEHFYEVMRGRDHEGTSWRVEPLSPEQAGAVVWLLDLLDPGDARLEVARGQDHLSDSDEYDWCERCGAVPPDDASNCRERACPVQAGWCEEDRPEWFEPAEGEE